MGKRAAISSVTSTEVLTQTARRCALCFGINKDLRVKRGQIAHIDQDPANSEESNLVFLCLDHHDEYDGRTSQSKNITAGELRIYKAWLTDAIMRNAHVLTTSSDASASSCAKQIKHDRLIFSRSEKIMTELQLKKLVNSLLGDDSYMSEDKWKLTEYAHFFSEAGNQFISDKLVLTNKTFLENADHLIIFVAKNFFYYPDKQSSDNSKYCLYPDLNVDRNGFCQPGSAERYERYANTMTQLAIATRSAYVAYRAEIKAILFL